MRAPYIQGIIHDGDGRTTQFLLGPDGYRQWGWSGPTGTSQEAYASNVAILQAMEEAAETAHFFDDAAERDEEEA